MEPQRLYRQIAEQLRSAIEAGEYAVGARLPAERDLAKQLGVSRPSVREALIALEVEAWVEVRTGSGVYVLEHSGANRLAASVLTPAEWGPLELIRACRVVEGETAAIAATRAKRRDTDAMHSAIDAIMVAAADQGACRGWCRYSAAWPSLPIFPRWCCGCPGWSIERGPGRRENSLIHSTVLP